jgi:hypothetical protein
VSNKIAVCDRVFVAERRRSGPDVYTPATVTDVARVYCRVKIDGAPYAMSQRFDAVTGAGEWPSSKGGMCPLALLRPEQHARIVADRAARMAAEVAAEQAATERLHALGVDLLPGRRSRIAATTLLATVERYGVTP